MISRRVSLAVALVATTNSNAPYPGLALFGMGVVDGGRLQISEMGLPVGIVSSAYGFDIPVIDVGGTALAKPLSWRVVGGALPPGLLLGQSDERALLSGPGPLAVLARRRRAAGASACAA